MLLRASYILPITAEPLQDGAVLVRDGRIADIGAAERLQMRYPDDEVLDFPGAALLPGFVDAHTHLEYFAVRGMVHDKPYVTWLKQVSDLGTQLEPRDRSASAVLGCLDALSGGITCVADVSETEATCAALQAVGLRGVVYREVTATDKRRVDHALGAAVRDVERWRSNCDAQRLSVGVAPAALHRCHPSVLSGVSQLATRENLPVALHLAGSIEEYKFIRSGSSALSVHGDDIHRGFVEVPPWLPTGVSPVRYALNWGAFEAPQVLAVHCVHVDEEDVRKLAAYQVAVATCPRCNAQLGMGVAPVHEFMRAGLAVGIGTDSPAATESTDMFSEMRIGLLLQRAVNVGEFVPSRKALEMATLGGATALGLGDRIGSLEVGKCADLVAVDVSDACQGRNADPESALVNVSSTGDVVMTMVDGKVLYERGRWQVDVEVAKNIARVIEIRSRLRVRDGKQSRE